MHPRINFKHTAQGTIFRHNHIILFIVLNQIFLTGHNERIPLRISRKVRINPTQLLLDFNIGLQLLMGTIKRSISGHNKQQMPEVSGEVLFDKRLGELMIEVGPYGDIDTLLLLPEEVVEELLSALSITDLVMVVEQRVVECDWFGGWGLECARLDVLYIQQSV